MCKRISINVCSETPFSKKPTPHRNQSADLLRKSIDWFLYDTSPHRKVFPSRLYAITNCNELFSNDI